MNACAYICKQILAYMEARRDVFQAIADPTPRQIIDIIAKQPLNLNSVAEKFDMTRQAVSLHIKILEECGLIMLKQQGRERYCEVKFDKLNEVSVWIDQYKQYWEQKLDSMEKYLNKLQKNKSNGKTKNKHS